MEKKKAEELLDKYLKGRCDAEERLLVESWYNAAMDEQEGLPEHPGLSELSHARQEIYRRLPTPGKAPLRRRWYACAAAVALLLAALTATRFYAGRDRPPSEAAGTAFNNDIAPGGNVAVLTLADGSRIRLDERPEGTLAVEGDTHILKLDGGQLAYEGGSANGNAPAVHNTLETPRGGQYSLVLPDGSKVWLNAASSITYPTAFTDKKRVVEITGEAYFEVARDKERPFLVRTGRQEVEVLGTRFNINAYPDEGTIRTTLVEGSVKILSHQPEISRLLVPGEQSSLKDGSFSVAKADTEEALAWKNGYFMFVNDENIRVIMREVARWYDVDVRYEGNMEEVNFTGTVSRFERVSVLLEKLQLTGMVRFEIKGRTVTVISNEK